MLSARILAVLAASLPVYAAPFQSNDTSLNSTFMDILALPLFEASNWGLCVRDRASAEILYEYRADKLYTTGSIMKTTTTSTVLRSYGPQARFNTTVKSTASIVNGTLDGDLILLAAGDYSFGLR